MASLATVDDVATAMLRTLDTDETALATALLPRASWLVRQERPGLDTLIADNVLDADVVKGVVAEMVARVLRNPDGWRQKATGPFSGTYDVNVASGYLTITDNDRPMLGLTTADQRTRRVGTIRMRPTL